jgi:hypothetical protein
MLFVSLQKSEVQHARVASQVYRGDKLFDFKSFRAVCGPG